MASKRKKTRPTKFAREAISSQYIIQENHLHINEDEAALLQQFLDTSDDNPEKCFPKIEQSPIKKIFGPIEKVACGMNKMKSSSDNIKNSRASMVYSEHFSPNLQSHHLKGNVIDRFTNSFVQYLPEDDDVMSCDSILSQVQGEISSKLNGNIMNQDVFRNGDTITIPIPAVKKPPTKRVRVKNEDFPRYSCTTCKYVTNRSDHFKRHLITHSSDKPLKCTRCNYSTGRSDHYKRHLQRHGLSEKEVNECCSQNGVKLKNATGLLDYTTPNKLKEESDRQCQQCKQIFIDREAMLMHISTEHPGLSENTESTKSEKYTNSHADANLSDATNQKRYSCDDCGYTTNVKHHLVRHRGIHSQPNLSICEHCKRAYKTPGYLTYHRCKAQERKCQRCRQIFIDNDAMLEHAALKHSEIDDDKVLEKMLKEDGRLLQNLDNSTKKKRVESCEKAEQQVVSVSDEMTSSSETDSSKGGDIIFPTVIKNEPDDIIIDYAQSPPLPTFTIISDVTCKTETEVNSYDFVPTLSTFTDVTCKTETEVNSYDFVPTLSTVTDVTCKTETEDQSCDFVPPLSTVTTISDVTCKTETEDQSYDFVPKRISESEYFALGNLRCTKCGGWFDKLSEYTSHPCDS